MDIIFLHEVKVQTRLGVPEWERNLPQTVVLDIEIALPNSLACQTDAIEDALDYATVATCVRDYLATTRFRLVEALGENVIRLIMEKFGANWVRLRVSKPDILPGVSRVGIVLERSNKP